MSDRSKASIFIPTRSGSERVKNKNTRTFCGVEGGILRIKLQQILEVKGVKEVILSTNDSESIEVANTFFPGKIRVLKRPDALCKSETKVADLIKYVGETVCNEHIYWIHVTSPFVEKNDYEAALDKYLKEFEKDNTYSLASVNKIQQFLWDNNKKKVINHNIKNGDWPRTQDLNPIYEINHAFYINSKNNFKLYNNRVSPNMDVFELDKIKQIDIDWEEDFLLAEQIYKHLKKK